MKKILSLCLIMLFLNTCGYTPLYKDKDFKNIKFNYEIVEANGDQEINNYIISNLNKYLKTDLEEKIIIKINSSYSRPGISNDEKGKTTAYTLLVKTIFEIKINDENKKISFNEKIKINRFSDIFEQKSYEIKIKKNISELIVDKFVQKISALK